MYCYIGCIALCIKVIRRESCLRTWMITVKLYVLRSKALSVAVDQSSVERKDC